MKHSASISFWECYDNLPKQIQDLADKNFILLKQNPKHPSLHFKRIRQYWSVRIGKRYRALGVEVDNGFLWFWIGTHDDYEKIVQ